MFMKYKLDMLPKQSEILAGWADENFVVTCYVQSYDHANYIDETLRGILTQKTNFPFKIVVYDDFSTDGTQEIIKCFQEEYPDILFPYLAKFNHGKECSPRVEHQDLIEGKYVTICDGDDYWIDNYKLQKQYDLLESNKQKCLCIHPAILVFEGTSVEDLFCYYGNRISIIDQEVLFNIKNQFAPTSSYFMTKEKYLIFLDFLRKKSPGFGDFFIEAISSENGVLYIPTPMSVYRRGVESSSTTLQAKRGVKEHKLAFENNLENLDILESMYPFLANKIINRKMLVEIDFLLNALNSKDAGGVMKKEFKLRLTEIMQKLGGFSPEKYISPAWLLPPLQA